MSELSTASVLGALTAEVASMRDAVAKMTRAIETLVRVETTQGGHAIKLEDHEARLRKLETSQPGLIEMRLWIIGGFAAVVLVIVGAILTGNVHISVVR